jgi:hypothetical protein
VALATIQRWLGHHNISQTSKYLAASLGGDESAMMRAYEEKIGRVAKTAGPSNSTPDLSRSANTVVVESATESNAIIH